MLIIKLKRPEILEEELLNGKIATVYHQTHLPPQRFQEILERDEFRGTIGVYGRGLYTTLSSTNRVLAHNAYGEYTYKLKVSLEKYVIFSRTIANKIYGEELIGPLSQIEHLYGSGLLRKIQSTTTDFSAESISDILKTEVKGIVITDRRDSVDSAVVLAYDPSSVIPVGYSVGRIANNRWNTISPKSISKDLVRRSALGAIRKNKSEVPV
jgi:hypothetical protein